MPPNPPNQITTLTELCRVAEVPRYWDLILIGDGSGSKWNNPCGWACTMIVRGRHTGEIHYLTPFVGASSRGSINWAELMPYWIALRHHYYQMKGKELCKSGGVDAWIFSDSAWSVETMSGRNLPDANDDMIALFHFFEEKGYRISWRHYPRETIRLNTTMDHLSVAAREYISEIEPPTVSVEFPVASI
jgi:hypothetical protein